MVKDHNRFFDFVLDLAPINYHNDVKKLSGQISLTWNAFLRGQLVLCLVVGVTVFVLMTALGVPNARSLAIIAGFMELIPTFGPIFAAIPAVLIALFQSDASWLGSLMTPIWFGLLILGVYALVYQVENYYLVPRIIGYHLKLHPLVILLGVVAGASIAGVLGILLAAPTLATVRLIIEITCNRRSSPSLKSTPAGTRNSTSNSAASKSRVRRCPTPRACSRRLRRLSRLSGSASPLRYLKNITLHPDSWPI
jgi:predicted PurR-regulated permease PerM